VRDYPQSIACGVMVMYLRECSFYSFVRHYLIINILYCDIGYSVSIFYTVCV
jgi:hypothetical protein